MGVLWRCESELRIKLTHDLVGKGGIVGKAHGEEEQIINGPTVTLSFGVS